MNRVSQVLGAAAVIAIAVVFIVQFRPGTGQEPRGPTTTCAVEVRGDCVSSTEFWASYRLLAPRNADAAALRAMNLRRLTAEGLFERHLLNEDAKRLGITVSDDDVSAELFAGRAHVSLPVDHIANLGPRLGLTEDLGRYLGVRNRQTKKFDPKQYEKEVRLLTKMSPADFRDFQKKELVAARMRDLVRSRVRVHENEAFGEFSRLKSTRTIDYARFDRRYYAELVVDDSDKAVEAWAQANQDELDKAWEARKPRYLPECRIAREILVDVDTSSMEPEAAKAAAKEEAAQAAARAQKKPDDFAAIARATSDDPSFTKGGHLGCVTKGKLPKSVEEKLFSMKEGEISDPIETEGSYYVLKLEKIAKDADAEKIGRLEVARERYVGLEADRLAAEAAKQILAAVAGGKPLKDALQAHLDQLVPAPGKGGADKKDAKKGRKDEPKAPGDAPEKDETKEGDAAKKDERAPLTLETHPYRPVIETSTPFNVSGNPIRGLRPGADAARVAFELEKPGDVPKDLLELENGYVVLQLKEVKAADKEAWEKERETFLSAMRQYKQQDALAGYIRRLKSTIGAEMKYDQTLITEPKVTDGEQPALPFEDEGG